MSDMVKLKAVKGLRYATRQMLPGEDFEAKRKDAKVLIAIGKAEKPTEETARADLAALRAEYTAKFGKKPFGAWDAVTLAEKMAVPAEPVEPVIAPVIDDEPATDEPDDSENDDEAGA